MSQIAAMTSLRSLLSGISGWTLLHPDQSTTMQEATKPAARYYAPQLLSADPFKTWLCTVDVIASSVDNAQREGDKLLALIATNPARFPKQQLEPRAVAFRESGFARCNVQFQLKTD